mgnify:CR=1 FL=1
MHLVVVGGGIPVHVQTAKNRKEQVSALWQLQLTRCSHLTQGLLDPLYPHESGEATTTPKVGDHHPVLQVTH